MKLLRESSSFPWKEELMLCWVSWKAIDCACVWLTGGYRTEKSSLIYSWCARGGANQEYDHGVLLTLEQVEVEARIRHHGTDWCRNQSKHEHEVDNTHYEPY